MNNPAVTNLVLSLGMMQVTRRLPLDKPEYLWYLRGAYIAAQLLIVAIYYFSMMKIRKTNDLKVLKYVKPKSAMDPDGKDELVTTTVRDYDLAQAGQAIKGMGMGILMMGVMHGYFKMNAPLAIQSVMGIKSALESNIVKLHVWGAKPEGNLARPFKAPGGFMEQFTGPQGPQTDAASIKAAEKAGGKSE